MMKPVIEGLLRANIKKLKPYSSARNEYSGDDAIFLDANENPYNQPYNRYPDPMHSALRNKLASMKNVDPKQIFLGNGSDEGIDLLIRAFCEPKTDNIVTMSPTYGMYKVCADINDVPYYEVELNDRFQLNVSAMLETINARTKLVFLCSPNNPTGTTLHREDIFKIADAIQGLVILDEAYIDFSDKESLLKYQQAHQNLVILQTFSKAWGLAGIRFGMVYAISEIIDVLYKIKYPYNLNILTQNLAMDYLSRQNEKDDWVKMIRQEKKRLENEVDRLSMVTERYPTDANFLMIKVKDPMAVFNYLKEHKIIVRDRSKVTLCEGCLRVTIGNRDENDTFLRALQKFNV
jgi:histidinol-phosphate aminotransferase